MSNDNAERIRELVEDFVCELVDDTDAAKVVSTIGTSGHTVILTVTTADGDIGKVIGKQGRTAQALRFLLEAMAAKHRIKIFMEIDDGKR